MSLRARTHRQDIVISPVGINPDKQLSLRQTYPNNFVCNVPPEQQPLVEQAARELGFKITVGAPRNSMYRDSLGVYVASLDRDPHPLIDRFMELKLAAWQAEQKR